MAYTPALLRLAGWWQGTVFTNNRNLIESAGVDYNADVIDPCISRLLYANSFALAEFTNMLLRDHGKTIIDCRGFGFDVDAPAGGGAGGGGAAGGGANGGGAAGGGAAGGAHSSSNSTTGSSADGYGRNDIIMRNEDNWAVQAIGSPFPEKLVKVMGEPNQYVALWYKHGKPIHGRSWNNGGVVECSFAYKDAELKTKQQLEGEIQVLQYKGDHNDLGFWYNWIKYPERLDNSEKFRETVRCGDSFPILWKSRPEGALLGYVDNKTEQALFSADGKVFKKSGGELNDMLIIVRELRGAPPGCPCAKCAKLPPVADPKAATPMVVSSDAFAYGREVTNTDRITIEWINTPDGAANQFRRECS